MFSFTLDTLSGSHNQCLAKITSLVQLCVPVQILSVLWWHILTNKDNKTINYFEFSINTNPNNVDLSIYRKPAYINITIHFPSNHLFDHKFAAFDYYINRMFTMPIMVQAAKQ